MVPFFDAIIMLIVQIPQNVISAFMILLYLTLYLLAVFLSPYGGDDNLW